MYKTLIRPIHTFEGLTLHLDIAKMLTDFERNIFKRVFRATKIDNIWRKTKET